jgi:probable O-glycosylation ligase (exosortase A-associated)
MRDILFFLIFPFLLYGCYKRPFIGVGLCIWVALFYPAGWMYGAAQGIRYNFIFALLTIWGVLRQEKVQRFSFDSLTVLLVCFFAWTTLSSVFSLGPSEVVWDMWSRLSKIVILYFLVLFGVRKRLHIDFIFWCLVMSVGFFAVVEGLKYISSGGAHVLKGMAGHVLGDRNELSIAMVMLIPFVAYLIAEFAERHLVLKLYLFFNLLLLVVSILGTNSRGGFVSLAGLGIYFFVKSRRKFLVAFLAISIGMVIYNNLPPSWFERMDTLSEASSDSSFLGRVVAWKMNYILALKSPLFGGGFKAAETLTVWQSMVPVFHSTDFFGLWALPMDPNSSKAAHSIYFQVLGDHGFVGLFLFLAMLAVSFLKVGQVAKRAASRGGMPWVVSCATALRLVIFAYALGGSTLSFAYFDLLYVVFALCVVLERISMAPDSESLRTQAGLGHAQ